MDQVNFKLVIITKFYIIQEHLYFKVVGVLTINSLEKKSFSMILRLKVILLVLPYERKKIILYEIQLKLKKNSTFNNKFFNRTFPYYHLLPIFKK